MSDTLTTAQTVIVERIRKAATVTARNTLTIADGLVALKASGLSGRAVARHLAGTDYPLGVNRVAVIIRTREANPDADAETFTAALREATAANTARKPEPVTAEEAPVESAPAATVTTAAPKAEPVTVDTLTDRLADLFAAAREHLTGADLDAFLSAVDAEVAYSAPVAVAIPVAA